MTNYQMWFTRQKNDSQREAIPLLTIVLTNSIRNKRLDHS